MTSALIAKITEMYGGNVDGKGVVSAFRDAFSVSATSAYLCGGTTILP